MRELLREVGAVLASVPNRLTIEGHTDATPFGNGGGRGLGSSDERGYSNWELSTDRANASRRELLVGGLPEDQVLRVQGLAASNPFDRTDATAASNRRISIVVMTREAEDSVFRGSAPRTPPTPPAPAEPAPVPVAIKGAVVPTAPAAAAAKTTTAPGSSLAPAAR
jgi:chemotaxis protein MotB